MITKYSGHAYHFPSGFYSLQLPTNPTRMSSSRTKRQHFHPYAKGFRAPNKAQRKKAIGEDVGREYQPGEEFFSPIPKPSSENDWLAQYKEEGQSFANFMEQTPFFGKRKIRGMKGDFFAKESFLPQRYPGKSVCILPIGEFPINKSPQLAHLKDYAEAFFCLEVKVLPVVSLEVKPNRASLNFDESHREAGLRASQQKYDVQFRYHKSSRHYQLHVTSVLQILRNVVTEDAICTIAVTTSDMYESKSDLFIAGWAGGLARVACFSFRRYDPHTEFSCENWYEIQALKSKQDPQYYSILLERCCRLLVHEVAHMLGVDHCIYFECCMNGSGHLEEDFSQPMHLCPIDLKKLQRLCGFDVVERYTKLATFYQQHGMKQARDWARKCLLFLQKCVSDS